jgi:hypothetical protein
MPSPDRLPELGPRGEGWLVLQLLLGAAIAGCGFVGVYWPGSADSFLGILGLLIAVAGALRLVEARAAPARLPGSDWRRARLRSAGAANCRHCEAEARHGGGRS